MPIAAVRNWTDPSTRIRAVMVIRDTLYGGLPADHLSSRVKIDAARLDTILAGHKAPTVDELFDIVRHARLLRSTMIREIRDSASVLDDTSLDRMVMSE